jgi:hypothetical protein
MDAPASDAEEAGESDDKPYTEWDEDHGNHQVGDLRCLPAGKALSNHWLTHLPMRDDCPACQRAKMKQRSAGALLTRALTSSPPFR